MIKIWRRWRSIAEVIGNIQMTVMLSLVYWTLLGATAIPYRLLADPLGLRDRLQPRWTSRLDRPQDLESMKKQG